MRQEPQRQPPLGLLVLCVLEYYSGPACVALGAELPPPTDIEPSVVSGVSGFMLSISFSTGIVAGGGAGAEPGAF